HVTGVQTCALPIYHQGDVVGGEAVGDPDRAEERPGQAVGLQLGPAGPGVLRGAVLLASALLVVVLQQPRLALHVVGVLMGEQRRVDDAVGLALPLADHVLGADVDAGAGAAVERSRLGGVVPAGAGPRLP